MSASIALLPVQRRDDRGCIHVWRLADGGFEVGHESRSGDSWGNFSTYNTADETVVAAYALNRDHYGSACDVAIYDDVKALLKPSPLPNRTRGEF